MGCEYSTLEVNRLLPRLRLRQVDLVGVFSNQTDLSPTHAVELFLREELRLKEEHKREVRFKRSHLPARKSLGEFDFGFQPSVSKQVILNLMDMTWLDQAFNVCLLGPTSTGKTMLATILGYEALDRGYDVCFEKMDTLMHAPETKDFVPASERRVRELTRARLVIVDEIGYERLGQAEATLLFGFVSQCAERTSLVVTSNKGFDEWGGFMGDTDLVAAIVDRLIYRSEITDIDGPNYRKDRRQSISEWSASKKGGAQQREK